MSSRRSAALMRVEVTVTPPKLVTTHKFVKCLGHPIELGLCQAGVERQGERPLEGRVGAGEGALIRVRAQAMERIRADLALDALLAQPGKHAVALVDLDDVGLPAVAVAGIRARHGDRQ